MFYTVHPPVEISHCYQLKISTSEFWKLKLTKPQMNVNTRLYLVIKT